MRCLLVITALVAAAGAGTVHQSVSVGGSSVGGQSVSHAEMSSSVTSDSGQTLGTRSSFSSRRQEPAAAAAPPVQSAPAAQRPRPATSTAQRPRPATAQRPVAAKRPRPATVQRPRPRPATERRPRPAPVPALAAAARPVSGALPVIPAVRPLKPLSIHVPAVGHAAGGGIGTRFNSRPASVSPALAGAQASLSNAAHQLNAAMSSLGV